MAARAGKKLIIMYQSTDAPMYRSDNPAKQDNVIPVKSIRTLVHWCIGLFFIGCITSCSTQRSINKEADKILLHDATLSHAHMGISIFDPSGNKYLYNYQGDKYFVPASNTKIITCYAALKYLGD